MDPITPTPSLIKRIWNNIKSPIGWFVLIVLAVGVGNVLSAPLITAYQNYTFGADSYGSGSDYSDYWGSTSDLTAPDGSSCNIAVIPVTGDIVSYPGYEDSSGMGSGTATDPDTMTSMLENVKNTDGIKGVMTVIDSYGGDGSAGSAIANELKRFSLPTVSLVRSAAASAGYLIATGANTIIASPWSEVGSIGVTMSYVDYSSQDQKEGLNFVSLASGKFKDYMNPDKPLTAEERALLERDIKIVSDQFIKEVATNRNLPLEAVIKLADGSAMPGSLALQNKLIDQLGDKETARAWFAQKLGMIEKDIVFCEE